MAHSIELIFDEHTDAVIGNQWAALADAGLPSQGNVRTSSNRPHVTLIAADSIDPAIDTDLSTLSDVVGMTVNIGALLIFRGRRATAARLVVPSQPLLQLHARIFQLAVSHITGDPLTHVAPDSWTPHITLARRLDHGQIDDVVTALGDSPDTFTAKVAGLRRWNGDSREEFHLLPAG
jgi:2'-5' RNA ligase